MTIVSRFYFILLCLLKPKTCAFSCSHVTQETAHSAPSPTPAPFFLRQWRIPGPLSAGPSRLSCWWTFGLLIFCYARIQGLVLHIPLRIFASVTWKYVPRMGLLGGRVNVCSSVSCPQVAFHESCSLLIPSAVCRSVPHRLSTRWPVWWWEMVSQGSFCSHFPNYEWA